MKTKMDKDITCNFCGRLFDSDTFFEGQDGYICVDCVKVCMDTIIKTKNNTENTSSNDEIDFIEPKITPKAIKSFLDEYIIGQDEAKTIISVAVYNHYKRISNNSTDLDKSNILMIGNSGTGKTLISQTIAKYLDVPFVNIDSSSLTESGYVGEDVSSIIYKLYQNANHDPKKTEHGIVFVDEIDKKAKKYSSSHAVDPSGEGVQQALLKMIEGLDVKILNKRTGEADTINTKNILFIFGGSFVGIDKIVETRLNKNNTSIGFGATIEDKKEKEFAFNSVENEDLINFGLIPEFIGRVPIIAPLHDLSDEQMKEVLSKPKNSIIKQFKSLFKMDNINLHFSDNTLDYFVKLSKGKKTGVRGLRSIIEKELISTQYELPELSESGIKHIYVDIDRSTSNIQKTKRRFKKEIDNNYI